MPGHLGRLLLAARKGGELVYVGGCGTGWSNDLSRELRKLLEDVATKNAGGEPEAEECGLCRAAARRRDRI
ncbi:ATP dependent DNA ligase [Sinorhizobium medicae]|uniref:ATP dependent DNA ligase n=1 Tax=Sinorhizobium medicae TaxID=110321 RepID=UPI0035CF533F